MSTESPAATQQVGTVSSTGLYTAPAVVPTPYTVQITSSIAKYPTAVPGSVSIQVWNPIPVLSAVTPNGFSEGTTTVTVNGSQFVYGAQISWNGALVPTTYVSSTELVAQIAAPNPGIFPAHGHQPQSRIGKRASAFVEGGSRPGSAARLSPTPALTCASRTR